MSLKTLSLISFSLMWIVSCSSDGVPTSNSQFSTSDGSGGSTELLTNPEPFPDESKDLVSLPQLTLEESLSQPRVENPQIVSVDATGHLSFREFEAAPPDYSPEPYLGLDNNVEPFALQFPSLAPVDAISLYTFGADDRTPIYTNTSYPYRAIAKLLTNFPAKTGVGCTGSLIGSRYLLTAAHCVYNHNYGGHYTSLTVYPGYCASCSGSSAPYGSAMGELVYLYQPWTDSMNWDYDVALVRLNSTIGYTTGTLPYNHYPNIANWTLYSTGYPADLSSGQNPYYVSGNVIGYSTFTLTTHMDLNSGQSGSPIYNSTGYVHGVASYEVPGYYNVVRRIDSSYYNFLNSCISSNC